LKNAQDSSGIQLVSLPGSEARGVCPPSKVQALTGVAAPQDWNSWQT
jgi:hypothetical protein